MPVRVTIPIRLRVDPGALTERQADVEEALAAAVGRALVNSRDVVLEKRGGYVGVRVHPPEISWYGNSLDSVSGVTRAEIENRIANVLRQGIKTTSIYDLAQESVKAPQSIPLEIAEPIEHDRYAAILGRYMLPSYDRRGRPEAVEVLSSESETVYAGRGSESLFKSLREEEVTEALLMELQILGRTLPTSGYLGTIYRRSEDGYISIVVWRFPGDILVAGIRLTRLEQPDVRQVNGILKVEFVPVELSAHSTYRILHVRLALSPEQRSTALRAHWEPKIRQAILSNAAAIPPTMREVELRQAIEDTINQTIAGLLENTSDQTVAFFELLSGDHTYQISTNQEIPLDLEAELIPLIDVQQVRQRTPAVADQGDGVGTESQEGTGRRAGAGADSGTRTGERAAGEGASGTHGAGDGEGTAEPPGGFVHTGEPRTQRRGSFFPIVAGGKTIALVCETFSGEPSIADLGSDGEPLRHLVDQIAYKLQIPSCEFTGQFCLNAAAALGGRTVAIGSYAVNEEGITRQVTVNTGNLGSLQFVPTASPAIQLMRHLAGVTPLISELSRSIDSIYRKPEHRHKISGFRENDPIGWHLDFLKELTPLMKEAVGYLFAMTCRVLMLQLLRGSRTAIQNRLNNFATYAPLFEQLVLTQLADVNELIQLRDQLQEHQRLIQVRDALRTADGALPGGLAIIPGADWLEATRLITEALTVQPSQAQAASTSEARGQIIQQGSISRIRDAHGTLWSLSDLEASIATRRGLAEDIDPIVKQITDLPDIMQLFRADRTAIRRELRRLLNEMLDNNQQVTNRVTDSWQYAFNAGRIQEHLPAATIPGTFFALQGIHREAHEQIGEFFQGSFFYTAGIKALFNARLGAESLGAVFEFTGLILISVLCPPLGVGIGIALAAYQYEQALEREELYGALIDPELIISRAEVETELFAAKLGLAMVFIPEVGSIPRAGGYGVRAVSRAGLAGGSRIVGRYVARRITREMVEALSRNLALAFAQEIITNLVMDRVIGAVMEPLIREVEREATITGPVGGSQGAEMVRRMLAEERQAREGRSGSGSP